eukprot:scaffold1.g5850.t1
MSIEPHVGAVALTPDGSKVALVRGGADATVDEGRDGGWRFPAAGPGSQGSTKFFLAIGVPERPLAPQQDGAAGEAAWLDWATLLAAGEGKDAKGDQTLAVLRQLQVLVNSGVHYLLPSSGGELAGLVSWQGDGGWKGTPPKEALEAYCRQHKLPSAIFNVFRDSKIEPRAREDRAAHARFCVTCLLPHLGLQVTPGVWQQGERRTEGAGVGGQAGDFGAASALQQAAAAAAAAPKERPAKRAKTEKPPPTLMDALAATPPDNSKNPITVLKEVCDKCRWALPEYAAGSQQRGACTMRISLPQARRGGRGSGAPLAGAGRGGLAGIVGMEGPPGPDPKQAKALAAAQALEAMRASVAAGAGGGEGAGSD